MFTEKELTLLKYALSEINDWLENDDDFESICKKLNIETLDE